MSLDALPTRTTPPPEEEIVIRVRAGSWTAPGPEVRHLLVVACPFQAVVIGLGFQNREASVTYGVAISSPDAIEASDADLFAILPLAPATHADLEGTGLLDGHALPLLMSILAFPLPHRHGADVPNIGFEAQAPIPSVDLSSYGLMLESRASDVLRPRRRPFVPAPPPALFAPPGIEARYTRRHASLAAFELGQRCSGDRGMSRRVQGLGPFEEAVTAWAAGIADCLRPNGIALGGSGWTPRAHRHYAETHPHALRRKQAAQLHPAFAPILAHDPSLVAAIDAGIAHEPILDATLRRMLGMTGERRFGPARMRRLRSLPHGLWPECLHTVLVLAHGIRAELLPATPDGWTVFAASAAGIVSFARDLGLDLDPLLATPATPWREPLSRDDAARAAATLMRLRTEPGDHPGNSALADANDMAIRLAVTLVQHLLDRGADDPAKPGWVTVRAHRLAGRLLFAGRPLERVLGLSNAWHAEGDAFERRMPRPSDDLTWPALFRDFRAGPDIVMTCLTRPSALLAEGSSAADEAGPGLAHCVGGYVPDCACGRSHIVSIRRETADGRWERMSTAELTHDHDDGLEVVQHKGGGNAPPPYEAETALRHLLSAVLSEQVALNPEALDRPDLPADFDGIDWSAPESIAASFGAWAPYLPRRVAKGGVDGLSRTLAAMEAAGSGGAPR